VLVLAFLGGVGTFGRRVIFVGTILVPKISISYLFLVEGSEKLMNGLDMKTKSPSRNKTRTQKRKREGRHCHKILKLAPRSH
jgi:hypothetical protein